MPIEFAPPKYAVIVNALQARIEDGTYAPGVILPSETALMAEFNVSRPTVVRAFELLREHGWIDTQQGKGRYARGKPADPRGLPQHAAALLAEEVDGQVQVLDVAEVPAPARAAAALDVEEGTPVLARRWLLSVEGVGPVELSTAYVPVALADGAGLDDPEPLQDGLLRHLRARKQVDFDHATQRISARAATAGESRLLEVGRRECLVTVLLTVYDGTGTPVLAVDVVVPPSRHELEDTFPIS